MAKKHKDESAAAAVEHPASGAGQSAPVVPAAPVGGAVEIALPARGPVPESGPAGSIEPVGQTVAVTVRTLRDLLPSRWPVFLGMTALLVVGAIDAPVALGAGLAFEAVRRWEPATPR